MTIKMRLPLLASYWHLALAASFINPSSAFSPPPSWDQLQVTPSLSKPPRPIYQDSLPEKDILQQQQQSLGAPINSLPILYRDKDCICAASQTVWLALECKNVEYLTVLVSKEENNMDGNAIIPRIVWPTENDDQHDINDNDNDKVVETTSDPIKLLEQIQSRYPNNLPHFYPKVSSAVDVSRCNIMRLKGVMPRYSEPEFMSSAPFLFRDDGTLVKKTSHDVSLEEVEEMQEEYYLGKYFCGKDVSAADMVWAPYLERYAVQLPLLFPNTKTCNPRSSAYDEVNAWYLAMEKLPAYACCVQGDARHWRTCLEQVITLHNERATSDDEKVTRLPPIPKQFGWWARKNQRKEALWNEYATESRPWLADTPGREVALYLMRNREGILAAAAASISMDLAPGDADEALREVIQLLVDWEMGAGSNAGDAAMSVEEISENGRQMAQLISERIEVPRDMGMIPALALVDFVQSIQPFPQ